MTTDIIIHGERHRFVPHGGWSHTVPALLRFADRITTHGDLRKAATECGISVGYAENLRTQLRKLGVGI